jgi:hypothetical protein
MPRDRWTGHRPIRAGADGQPGDLIAEGRAQAGRGGREGMTLGELLNQPQPGTDAGTCYICGRETEHGYREPPSSSFTAFSSCYAGDVHCEYCRSVLKDRHCRFYSWVLTPDGLRLRDASDRGLLWRTLQDPPAGPWAAYQTNSGQKQGWIGIADGVNESRTTYRVAVDWLDNAVLVSQGYVQEHAPVIDALRSVQVTLDSLRSGSWSMLDYRRALDAGLEQQYLTAYRQAGNPQWEVMVNAHSADA